MPDPTAEMTPQTFLALNGVLLLLAVLCSFLLGGRLAILLVIFIAPLAGVLVNGFMLFRAFGRQEQGLGIAYSVAAALYALAVFPLLNAHLGKFGG